MWKLGISFAVIVDFTRFESVKMCIRDRQKTAETGAILLCAADMLLCGVCMAAVFVMEKTMRYTKRAAAVKPQADDSYM